MIPEMVAAVTTFSLLLVSSVLVTRFLATQGQDIQTIPLPQSSENISYYLDPNGPDVQYVVFTRKHKPFNLMINDFRGFEESGINIKIPTKIITHGFLSSVRASVFTLPKDAYLSTGDYNVIGMDWSPLCEFEYFSAMRGSQLAGDSLRAFLDFIIRAGVLPEDIHIIGHSLGAHVAGMGADGIHGARIGRVTGLDPASPGFNEVPPNLRLDPGDAQLVDVIHTYMRILSVTQPLGHVDFYPNGGRFQPGCPELLDIWKVADSMKCNHGRAIEYFVESILDKKSFKAEKCASVEEAIYSRCFEKSDVYMGHVETYQHGMYYVKTNVQYPYSMSA